jgi:transcription elongation GreA/GreB family factor
MSRAFLRNDEDRAVELPDRTVSPHRNLVTEVGLAAIDAALGHFEATYRAALTKGTSRTPRSLSGKSVTGGQDVQARRSLGPAEKSHVAFGMTVTLRRNDGREQSFQIVGEDEADPSLGTVSHVSPLARAVMTRGVGDIVEIAGQEAVILDIG